MKKQSSKNIVNDRQGIAIAAGVLIFMIGGGIFFGGIKVIRNVYQNECKGEAENWEKGKLYGDIADGKEGAIEKTQDCIKGVYKAVEVAKPVANTINTGFSLGKPDLKTVGGLMLDVGGNIVENVTDPDNNPPVNDNGLTDEEQKEFDEWINSPEGPLDGDDDMDEKEDEPVTLPPADDGGGDDDGDDDEDEKPVTPPPTGDDGEPLPPPVPPIVGEGEGEPEVVDPLEGKVDCTVELRKRIDGRYCKDATLVQKYVCRMNYDLEHTGTGRVVYPNSHSFKCLQESGFDGTFDGEKYCLYSSGMGVTGYCRDADADTKLGLTVLEELEEMQKFVGTHSADFSRSSTKTQSEQGITITISETTSGSISITFKEDSTAECTTNMAINFTTSVSMPGVPSTPGSGSGSSIRCSGSITDEGVFVVSGMLSGTAVIATQSGSAESPFSASGYIDEANKMIGSIQIGTEADDVAEIEFEEK